MTHRKHIVLPHCAILVPILAALGLGANPVGAQESSADCFPACRSGFICHNAQCVSACNPPCAPGQACSTDGQCLDSAAPASTVPPSTVPQAGPIGTYTTPPPPRVRFSRGLYGRAAIGFGRASISTGTSTSSASGMSIGYDLAVGAFIFENTALQLNGFGTSTVGLSGSDAIVMAGFGLGATHYLQPAAIFLSGSFGLVGNSYESRDSYYRNDSGSAVGMALNFTAGKDWPVRVSGTNVGVGVGAQGILGYFPSNTGDTGTSIGICLNLFISYNE